MVTRVRPQLIRRPSLWVVLLALTVAAPTQAVEGSLFSLELKTQPGPMGERVRSELTELLRTLDGVTLVRRGGELVMSVAINAQAAKRGQATGLSVVLLEPVPGELLQGLVVREQHHVVRSLTADAFRIVNHWMLVEPGANVRRLCRKALARFEAEVLEPERTTRRILARRGVTVVQERLVQLGYQPGRTDGTSRDPFRVPAALRTNRVG